MLRTILNSTNVGRYYWAEVVNTTCYIHNNIYIQFMWKKTLYELWKGCQPNISYFHAFECKCFILSAKDPLTKFVSKGLQKYIIRSFKTTAYRVYNSRSLIVEESIHVRYLINHSQMILLQILTLDYLQTTTRRWTMVSKVSPIQALTRHR